MELRKWNTNSSQLQNLLNQKKGNVDNSPQITSIKSHEVTKVLGLVWDKTTDSFTFSSDHLLEILSTNMTTKRFVLRASARIFDPLGFLSPYVIRVKILFQRIWQHGLGWDEELPEALRQEWTTWCAELKDLPRIMAPRHLQNADGESKLELHVFTDASPQAYGACADLRAVDRKENVSVTLVFAKSRVAPLKTLTLPRLELMGALLGARVAKYLCTVLFGVVVTLRYRTDSMITLGWIKGSATAWKPFVGNRVTEIQALSDPSNWHHCPGSANPADALTRGKTVMQLTAYQLWWSGPEWLSREEGNWPIGSTSEDENLNGIDGERRQQVGEILLTTVSAPTALLTLENFSSYTKMLRVIAWIKRFVQGCRRQNKSPELPLTADDTRDAEAFWIKNVQRECFGREIQELVQGGSISKGSRITDLQPFLDDTGTLRIRGRLHQSTASEEVRHPTLLLGDITLSPSCLS
ncbi:uncharacterized protein LOC120840312 [Ixodes scapularis]|uniref:uncharacterized protein LOC120840312 n=1 Tax=Ixodes scapularis TaxID=6945 RepID=UPI001A9CDBC8|nr:uncharacterized protein LOC120840312 [Ixodes scapularis]